MPYGKPIPARENAYFICEKCGKQVNPTGYSSGYGMHAPAIPSPQAGGKCPDTASGNHVWKQC